GGSRRRGWGLRRVRPPESGSSRWRPSPNGRERRGSRNRWRWRTPRRLRRSPDRSHGRRWSWQSSFLFGVARGSRVARGTSPTLWRKPRGGNALLTGRRDLEHLVSSLGLTRAAEDCAATISIVTIWMQRS